MARFEVVGAEEWADNVATSHYRAKYEDAIAAIMFLIDSPMGTKVKVESGDNPRSKRKALCWYANRRGISLRTYLTNRFIYIRKHDTVLSVKPTKGELNHQSGGTSVNNQRGPLTSRGRSLNTGVVA
jgi:hypothetical protein